MSSALLDLDDLIKSGVDVGAPILVLVERVDRWDVLVKGKSHKYIMRVPTGKPRPKWRYYYKLPGAGGGKLAQSNQVVQGSRFSDGEGGHYEVIQSFADPKVSGGGTMYLRHYSPDFADDPKAPKDGKGRKFKAAKMTYDEFAAKVNDQHKATRTAVLEKRRAEIKTAMNVLSEGRGGPKQAQRVRRLVNDLHKRGWIKDNERDLYMQRIDKRAGMQQQQPDAQREAVADALKHTPTEHREALMRFIEAAGAPGGAGAPETKPKAPEAQPEQEKPKAAAEAKPEAEAGGKKDGGIGLRGSDEVMFVADESGTPIEQKARYRLVELGDIKSSHDPKRNFAPRKDYPDGVQERHYDKSKFSQAEVEKHARTLRPRLLITDNPDAANGPPIIQPDGIVLGGNSRTMTMEIAYDHFPEKAQEYRDALAQRAKAFGFSAGDVEGMKQPVLVREVDAPKDKAHQIDLVRRYNEAFTREMDPRSEQVAKAKRVGEKTLQALADSLGTSATGEAVDETFNAYLSSSRSKALIRAMMDEGVFDMRNVDKYVNQFGRMKGLLNEGGRAMVGRILLGKVVDDVDTLETMGQANRDKLSPHIAHIIRAGEANKAYDLRRAVKAAADVLADMTAKGTLDPQFIIGQRSLLGGGSDHPVLQDPLSQAVLAALWGKSSKEIGAGFRAFAAKADADRDIGVSGMFGGGPTSEEKAVAAIKRAFDFDTDDPLQEVREERAELALAAAAAKKQRAAARLKAKEARRQRAAQKIKEAAAA